MNYKVVVLGDRSSNSFINELVNNFDNNDFYVEMNLDNINANVELITALNECIILVAFINKSSVSLIQGCLKFFYADSSKEKDILFVPTDNIEIKSNSKFSYNIIDIKNKRWLSNAVFFINNILKDIEEEVEIIDNSYDFFSVLDEPSNEIEMNEEVEIDEIEIDGEIQKIKTRFNRYFEIEEYEKAFEMAEKLSNIGEGEFTAAIGYFYTFGLGVEKNLKTALEYFQKAYDEGFKIIGSLIGGLYIELEEDSVLGLEFLEEAREAGSKWASLVLGIYYEKGYGVLQNVEKALELYTEKIDEPAYKYFYSRLSSNYDNETIASSYYEYYLSDGDYLDEEIKRKIFNDIHDNHFESILHDYVFIKPFVKYKFYSGYKLPIDKGFDKMEMFLIKLARELEDKLTGLPTFTVKLDGISDSFCGSRYGLMLVRDKYDRYIYTKQSVYYSGSAYIKRKFHHHFKIYGSHEYTCTVVTEGGWGKKFEVVNY